MIEISRKPKFEFGGAPTPTIKDLKQKLISLSCFIIIINKILFTNKDNGISHNIHHQALQKIH